MDGVKEQIVSYSLRLQLQCNVYCATYSVFGELNFTFSDNTCGWSSIGNQTKGEHRSCNENTKAQRFPVPRREETDEQRRK